MIALDQLCRRRRGSNALLLNRLSASFAPGSRTAILAAPGSGKSTLTRLIAGMERPDAGHVRHLGCLPPRPLGQASAFNPWLSGAANLRLLAAIAGARPEDVLAFAEDLTGYGPELDVPLTEAPPAVRAKLAFALSYALPQPWLLADEVTAGSGSAFRQACDDMLTARLARGAGMILIGGAAEAAGRWAQTFFALARGRLLPADTPEEAAGLALAAPTLPRDEVNDAFRTFAAYA